MNAFLDIKPSGEVIWHGTQHGDARLHSFQTVNGETYITVKFAGRHYWSGRGDQGYAGAEFRIFWIVGRDEEGTYRTVETHQIPVRPVTASDELAAFIDNRFPKET
jgi:hypothetical protein